ncbi:MAG: SDR family NAD(P)-dependent oxidoreductase [Nocardioides sp.]
MSLNGRVIAITGGARGIGDATARALAAAGARVVIGDRDLDLAKQSAQEYDGLALPLDVSREDSFAEFLDGVVREHGRLDVLVNNAGFMVLGAVLDESLERQLAQVDVNLKGVVIGSRAAAERMGSGGVIVNIASLAGRIPMPGGAVYSATKAGVLAFSEALDAELVARDIRVAAVLPSFTNTSLIDGTHGTGRLMQPVEPEDVAAAVMRAIENPKPITTVPAYLSAGAATWSLTAARFKPAMRRRFGLDKVFLDVDRDRRASYVERND